MDGLVRIAGEEVFVGDSGGRLGGGWDVGEGSVVGGRGGRVVWRIDLGLRVLDDGGHHGWVVVGQGRRVGVGWGRGGVGGLSWV